MMNISIIKEENMEKQHKIPLGTLVEFDCYPNEIYGLQLFVVKHTRDYDGNPSYSLGNVRSTEDSWMKGWYERYLKIVK